MTSGGYISGGSDGSGGLVSGEGVQLDLVRAGIASRTVAALIDVVIQAVALVLLLVITLQVAGGDSAALAAVLIVEIVLVVAGYPIVLEWSTRGRTVGKIALGLRVVRDDGGPIGFRQALVRGLSSLVLEKPGLAFPVTTAAGVITLGAGRDQKRIGDHLAGTIVLDERAASTPLVMTPPQVAYPLVQWAQSLDLSRFDDALALQVRHFVTRAYAMTPGAQAELANRLYERVLTVVAPPPPRDAPIAFVLTAVLAERRRRVQSPAPQQFRPAPPYPSAPDSQQGFAAPG